MRSDVMEVLFIRIVRPSGLMVLESRPVALEGLDKAIDLAFAAESLAEIADERISLILHQRTCIAMQCLENSRRDSVAKTQGMERFCRYLISTKERRAVPIFRRDHSPPYA